MDKPTAEAALRFFEKLEARQVTQDWEECRGQAVVVCTDTMDNSQSFYGPFPSPVLALAWAAEFEEALNEFGEEFPFRCTVHPLFSGETDA